eukprot:TRINITY_DN5245_c0_g1_i1.p1 TRINITY_DN5245_c0_g1~~TRINITY_DN5245_c0_g1_i1.p1  ORF type:complete len:514 (+),score=162.79 TRINITY_DN5245_c0_g1_i1:184-1725(+)
MESRATSFVGDEPIISSLGLLASEPDDEASDDGDNDGDVSQHSEAGSFASRTHSATGSVPPLMLDNGTISMPFMKEALALFRKYDVDNSGAIDVEELRRLLNDMFAKNSDMSQEFRSNMLESFIQQYDRNKDGTISWQEFLILFDREDLFAVDAPDTPPAPVGPDESMWLREAHAMFRQYDVDNSGSIDKLELEALLNEVFAAADMSDEYRRGVIEKTIREYDKNNDGKISWKEFVVLFDKEDLMALPSAAAPPPFGIKDAQRLFMKYDKDRSGTIDKKEIENLLKEAFNTNVSQKMRDLIMQKYIEEYDVNGDGVISWEEFQILFLKEDFITMARSLSETGTRAVAPPRVARMAPKKPEPPRQPEVLPANIRTVGKAQSFNGPALMISQMSLNKTMPQPARRALPSEMHRAVHTPPPVGGLPFGMPMQLPSIPGAKREIIVQRGPVTSMRRHSVPAEVPVEHALPAFLDKRAKPPEPEPADRRRVPPALLRKPSTAKYVAPPLSDRRRTNTK